MIMMVMIMNDGNKNGDGNDNDDGNDDDDGLWWLSW